MIVDDFQIFYKIIKILFKLVLGIKIIIVTYCYLTCYYYCLAHNNN